MSALVDGDAEGSFQQILANEIYGFCNMDYAHWVFLPMRLSDGSFQQNMSSPKLV